MDDARFDAWTRRKFGLMASGLAAACFSLAPRDSSEAKQSKRKKRCKKVIARCRPGAKRRCCGRLVCRDFPHLGFHRCCNSIGESCANEEECCLDGDCIDGECVLD